MPPRIILEGMGSVQRFAPLEPHGVEPVEVGAERFVVRVVRIFFNDGDHRIVSNETGDIIHVAVRVVAINSIAQPEDLFDAKLLLELVFDLCAVELGVAVRVEQAAFGGEDRSSSVDVY